MFAANAAACRIFQMSEAEICDRGREGLVDLNDPRLEKALKERERNGSMYSEMYMLRKDGTRFPTEISSSVFYVEDETVPRTSMIIRDVTEKVLFQEELKKSEERYRSLFDANPLPVFIFDEFTLEILDVNERTCLHYLYEKDEIIGKNLKDIRPEEQVKMLEEVFERNRKDDNVSWSAHTVHTKKDGTPFHVSINSHRINIGGRRCVISACEDVTERKKNIQKLTDTSQKLKIAQDIAKLGYWKDNPEKNALFCSEQIFKIFGLEPVPNPDPGVFQKFIHPEDQKEYDRVVKIVFEQCRNHDFEFRIITKEGKTKWLNSKSNIIENETGKIIGFEGTIQDITSIKNAIQDLKKSEARYKGLLYTQTNYFVRINMEGNYTYCNYKFRDDFGWLFPNEDPIGNSATLDVMEYHIKAHQKAAGEAIQSPGIVVQVEIDKKMPDDKCKTTLWDMIYLENDGSAELQCIGIDISARVKAEKNNEFQANLLDKIGQGVTATDKKFNVIYWNNSAENMYGYTQEEVLGRNIHDILQFEKNPDDKIENFEKLKTGYSITGELMARKKDRELLPVQLSKSPLFDSNNELEGIVSIHSDISDLKTSERELKKLNQELRAHTNELVAANKGLEQFSYIVSHNLRAPVANILGIAELFKNGTQDDETKQILRQEMFNNVDRLDNVVKDLNNILSVKANTNLKRERIDLHEMVDSIFKDNNLLIENENVILRTNFKAIREVKTVKVYLHSILSNLISNSIKYKRPDVDPEINITTEIDRNQVIIIFSDNGLGIDIARKGKDLFGLYKRFHYHVEGKGMGLFMVKTQVEMLGGKIEVKSMESKGTEFIISFNRKKIL